MQTMSDRRSGPDLRVPKQEHEYLVTVTADTAGSRTAGCVST